MYSSLLFIISIEIILSQEIIPKLEQADQDKNATQILSDTEILHPLSWKDINITLPQATSHQVIGYYSGGDRVYLLGGEDIENEYWSLQFDKSYEGWHRHTKDSKKLSNIKIIEYQQSYFSSQHNIIYIKTSEFIHIYDMEIEYFNEEVLELPGHLSDGCMTVYYEPNDSTIEYLIIIGSKTEDTEEPTTYIYKVDQKSHNITWFDIGPDLLGMRENFCCTVMDKYLYVIGGTYSMDTRFVEQWLIDIDTAYRIDSTVDFDNFTNIDTLINTEVANHNLPQYGHRCVVNKEKQQIYVIGGITEEDGLYFNYSRYIFVLERKNNSLYEMNYRETQQEMKEEMNMFNDNYYGKILPSLPMEMAYTSPMMDKYGYLNIFGGELQSGDDTNKWLRINTKTDGILTNNNDDGTDVIWAKHTKHNHNEQWALLILLIMIILVGLWFKCIERISKLRKSNRNSSNGRGSYTDGTAYDEISGTSEIDELEDDDDDDADIDDDNIMINGNDSISSEENYSKLNGIVANHSDLEQNAEVVI